MDIEAQKGRKMTATEGAALPDVRQRTALQWVSVDRALEIVAAFTIAVSLIGLAAALVGMFYAPQVLLSALLVAGLYVWRTKGREVLPGRAKPRWRHLALLLLIALFFRVPAYHYVLGGQDEGLYVNIAHHISYTGGLAVHDKVAQELQRSPYLQQYLQNNRMITDPSKYLEGVYSRNGGSSKLEFQFYDVFPVWIALFSGLFGVTSGVYALTLFALLSIALFYRLALLLTGSQHAALTAGGLLAFSPLHAFFSKLPVTEVPTLCFSLFGFTLLAEYWSAQPEQRQRRWLVLSVLAFACLFSTRISGFMYMPFFVAMAAATLICDKDLQRRLAIQWWAIGATFVYLGSVLYGLTWSHSYAHDIYYLSFEPLFGTRWKLSIAAVACAGLLGWLGVGAFSHAKLRRERLAARLAGPLNWLVGLVVGITLLLGILKIYRLGWTLQYAADQGVGKQGVGLAGAGWDAVAVTSLWTLVVFLGPLLMLSFLLLIGRRTSDPRLGFLRWFVAGFFLYVALLQWTIPYSPYYARYLLSEFVPYLILLVVCAWSELRNGGMRAALSLALFFSVVYAGVLSAAQIGKSENDGVYQSLAHLVSRIDRHDLILLNMPNDSELKTPLLYTFHRNVVTIDDSGLANSGYLTQLHAFFDDLYLISPDPNPPKGFSPIDSMRFSASTFVHNHSYPDRISTRANVLLYLYHDNNAQFASTFTPASPLLKWLTAGWSVPESWGVWSDANSAVLTIDSRVLPQGQDLDLQLDAQAYVSSTHPQQRIDVNFNGTPIGHYKVVFPTAKFTMHIPLDRKLLKPSGRIRIGFNLPDAESPKSLGEGEDPRKLALGLLDAIVTPASSPRVPEAQPATAVSSGSP